MLTPPSLACSIDLHAPGKRIGHLQLAWSDNAHGYGVIPVPIAVIAGQPGPSMLVTAGVHGDEYEGLAIARRLIAEITPADVTGRLLVMPAVNLPAVRAGSRCSPIDDGNMNRVFPGDPAGGPTAQIASFIEQCVVPGMACALDLHSGGKLSIYAPCGYVYGQGSVELRRRKLAAAHAFGAPRTVVVSRPLSHGSLSAAAERCGVVMVAAELGGGGALDPEAYRIGWRGTIALLRHAGVLRGTAAATGTALFLSAGQQAHVMATIDGLFEPAFDLGASVEAGDVAGRIWPMDDLSRAAEVVSFATAGTVLARRADPRVVRGDTLCHTGTRITDEEFLAL